MAVQQDGYFSANASGGPSDHCCPSAQFKQVAHL